MKKVQKYIFFEYNERFLQKIYDFLYKINF